MHICRLRTPQSAASSSSRRSRPDRDRRMRRRSHRRQHRASASLRARHAETKLSGLWIHRVVDRRPYLLIQRPLAKFSTTPTIVFIESGFRSRLPTRLPTGSSPGKYFRASVSLMIATFGCVASSSGVKTRPLQQLRLQRSGSNPAKLALQRLVVLPVVGRPSKRSQSVLPL